MMVGYMLSRLHVLPVIALTGGLLAAACGGESTPERPAATAKADGPGSIAGKVSFDGEPPVRTPVKMAADPNCKPGPESLSETTVVSADRGLKNVFVYVKDGLGNAVYETPTTPISMDRPSTQVAPPSRAIRIRPVSTGA